MKTAFSETEKKHRATLPAGVVSSTLAQPALSVFSKIVLTGFGWFFLIWFFWLFLSLCLFNNSTFEYVFWKQSAAAVALVCAIALGYHAIQRQQQKRPRLRPFLRNRFLLIFTIGMIVIFICQLVYVGLCTTSIGWDCGTLVRNAKAPDMGTTIDYFHQYPNNLFLLLFDRFFVLIFAFFKLPGVWAGLNVINTIAIDVAIILTVLLARRMFGLKGAYIAWFFCIAAIAFFPYLIVPYSDTMGMPFAISVLYCYMRICDGKKQKERILFSVLLGVCSCVGLLIKPTLIIPLIAVVLIHFLFTLKNKKKLLKSGLYLVLTLATLFVSNACYQGFATAHFPQDEDLETPMTHFAMMGLKESKLPNGTSLYGGFSWSDVKATTARPTKEAKTQYNLRVIKERISGMGVGGYLSYLNNKARWVTSEGNFFWGGEGYFANFDYMTDSVIKELINSGSNQLGFYMKEDGKTQQGAYFDVYFYLSQAVWMVLMFCIAAPLFLRKKERGFDNKNVMILRCSIFGLMLFLLFFEARSRYLINQLPYFILLATYGLCALTGRTKPKRKTALQK